VRADPAAVDVLGCLECGGPLRLTAVTTAGDGHVMEGRLACGRCPREYPIRRGVPRMIPRRLARQVEQTVDAFGYQWRQANVILRDARFSAPEVFLDFIHPVEPAWFREKIVLDGGCGIGRFTIASATFGARLVIGIDLSDSVDVAFDNTRHLPNVVIAQADILELPLQRAVDYAFSVAVLHHTADPRAAFLHMTTRVVPGGSVSAWVYGREHNGWIVHVINPMRRITSRLPRPLLLALAHAAAVPLTIAARGVYGPVARRPALRWMRAGLFYFEYMAFLAQFGYREHAFIVFDHAVPAIAEYISRDEFAEWFRAAGLEQVVITMRGGNSWRGFGLVPQVVISGSPASPLPATRPTPTTTPTES
jgi:SAM-dependent methyltransferase